MATPPIDIVDTVPPEPMFTHQDRCDTCRAQAWSRAIVNGSELLYCIHHFRKYEERLILVAEKIDVDYDGFERMDDGR